MEIATQEENTFQPYLVKPVNQPPRLDRVTVLPQVQKLEEVAFVWEDRDNHEPLIIDIETKGTTPYKKDNHIVGIGFADSRGSLYFDLRESYPDLLKDTLTALLHLRTPLIAHNVAFEAAFMLEFQRRLNLTQMGELNWYVCTYALYRQLATEKFFLQEHTYGLKTVERQMLGWEETNEIELDNWLYENGHRKGKGVDKSKMYLAPADVLGHYCALDCDATYLFYTHCLKQHLDAFPHLHTYHTKFFMRLEHVLAAQQLDGFNVDVPKLQIYKTELEESIVKAEAAFINDKKVKPFVDQINIEKYGEIVGKEPDKYNKSKVREEPQKFKKDGTVSKAWLSWEAKSKEGPLISKKWQKWDEKRKENEGTQFFNMNSDTQMRRLYYDYLKFPVIFTTKNKKNPDAPKNPSIDANARSGFGTIGKLHNAYEKLTKELQFVEGCLQVCAFSESGSRVHPHFRVPGTFTGRLSGGSGDENTPKLNAQNPPKSKRYLECWKPPEGKVWLSSDFAALEYVILTALSGDKNMYTLYGPGAKPNDSHLFLGATIPGMREKILATGYDPFNPTITAMKRAKSECKAERDKAKTCNYAFQYGAGAKTVQLQLKAKGTEISDQEAFALKKAYDDLYPGVAKYKRWLEQFHSRSGGWIPTALGRPITLWNESMKDLLNNCVQASGHDVHILYIYYWSQMLKEQGIPYKGVVVDFHDESIVEIDIADAEKALKVFRDATDKVSEYLGGEIKLATTPKLVYSMAEAKCED